jgi:hypothetical protein
LTCRGCGEPVTPDSQFCGVCGKLIEARETPPPPPRREPTEDHGVDVAPETPSAGKTTRSRAAIVVIGLIGMGLLAVFLTTGPQDAGVDSFEPATDFVDGAASTGAADSSSTLPPDTSLVPKGQAAAFIVRGLRFFAGGPDAPGLYERQYSTIFPRTIHTIHWELHIEYPNPSDRLDNATVDTRIHWEGQLLGTSSSAAFRVDPSPTSSILWLGWSAADDGLWAPGTYVLELAIDGEQVATGSFRIE